MSLKVELIGNRVKIRFSINSTFSDKLLAVKKKRFNPMMPKRWSLWMRIWGSRDPPCQTPSRSEDVFNITLWSLPSRILWITPLSESMLITLKKPEIIYYFFWWLFQRLWSDEMWGILTVVSCIGPATFFEDWSELFWVLRSFGPLWLLQIGIKSLKWRE